MSRLPAALFTARSCTFPIVEAKLDAVIVPKIKFGKVAVQMLLFAMLIDAAHSALEN